jgi:hypothetical protein
MSYRRIAWFQVKATIKILVREKRSKDVAHPSNVEIPVASIQVKPQSKFLQGRNVADVTYRSIVEILRSL